MGPRAFILLGLVFAIVLIALEASARELAETEQIDKKNGLEESKCFLGEGGYFGGPQDACGDGDGGRCGGNGCCGGGIRCICCNSPAEAEAYAAAQAKAKPRN